MLCEPSEDLGFFTSHDIGRAGDAFAAKTRRDADVLGDLGQACGEVTKLRWTLQIGNRSPAKVGADHPAKNRGQHLGAQARANLGLKAKRRLTARQLSDAQRKIPLRDHAALGVKGPGAKVRRAPIACQKNGLRHQAGLASTRPTRLFMARRSLRAMTWLQKAAPPVL